MKRIHVVSLSIVAAILSMTASVSAQERSVYTQERPSGYWVVKGGIYSPSDTFDLGNINAGQTNRLDSSSRFAGELAVGRYFFPFMAVELGGGYFDRKAGPDTRLRVIPAVATGKLVFPIGPVEPYGEFGIGAYFSTLDFPNRDDTTKVTYGLHAGAGVNFNFTNHFFLGAEGRYIWTEPSFGGEDVKLDGFITTGNLGFRF